MLQLCRKRAKQNNNNDKIKTDRTKPNKTKPKQQ